MSVLIVDTHVHIYADDRTAYPQIAGQEQPLTPSGSAETLRDLMDQNGVGGAVLVQAPWYGEDNRYFVAAMHRFPSRFAALGYLPDPLAPEAPEKLAYQYHTEGFRGIRIHLLEERIVAGVAAGHANALIRRAGELRVPVAFLNRTPERHDLILALARRFPEVIFINDHLGHPRIGEGCPYAASEPFFACGALPNVYAKLSLHNIISHEQYPWRDLHAYQQMTVAAYGARKLMWGSNFPMQMPTPSYRQRLDAVRSALPFLTDDERAWILGGTACSLWPQLVAAGHGATVAM